MEMNFVQFQRLSNLLKFVFIKLEPVISFNIDDVRRVQLPSSLSFLAHGYPRASLDEDSSPNGPIFDSLQLGKIFEELRGCCEHQAYHLSLLTFFLIESSSDSIAIARETGASLLATGRISCTPYQAFSEHFS